MATVRTNPILNGLSGMLGRTIVFKNLRGKTIVASCPSPPQRQSEQQKTNRNKFRDASHWARMILLDAARKEYYLKKAKKMKLPNAYTAAITDYMRSPKLAEGFRGGDTVTYEVSKKGFELKKVEVVVNAEGATTQTRSIAKDRYNEWTFSLRKAELQAGVHVYVTDDAGKGVRFDLKKQRN